METGAFRRRLLVLCGLLTGTMVAVSGTIGFVGLMVPHMVRLAVGSDHRQVLPAAHFGGDPARVGGPLGPHGHRPAGNARRSGHLPDWRAVLPLADEPQEERLRR